MDQCHCDITEVNELVTMYMSLMLLMLYTSNLTSKVLCLLEQATTKINVAVDNLPKFKSCKLGDPDSGPQHVGTIHIGSERFAIYFVFVFEICFLLSSMGSHLTLFCSLYVCLYCNVILQFLKSITL